MEKEIYSLSNKFSLYNYDLQDGPYLLFNIDSGNIYRLNKTSYTMIELINGQRTIEEILELLYTKYQAAHDEIKNDLLALIKQWVEKKVLIKREEVS